MGGMIIYEGPSLLDGEPIVAIATPDGNPKIGEMLCTWVILQKQAPELAVFNGADVSICGNCKYRALPSQLPDTRGLQAVFPKYPKKSRTCYVRLTLDGSDGNPPADEKMPPSVVWEKWKNGGFGKWQSFGPVPAWQEDERRMSWYQYHGPLPVRIGSYGDPAAVPTAVWADLVRHAKNWTGYTHMWRDSRCDPDLKRYCMSSVDSLREWDEAKSRGWVSFIVLPAEARGTEIEAEVKRRGAILCPMTAGKPITCKKCCLCKGQSGPARDIYEFVHGVNQKNHQWWDL